MPGCCQTQTRCGGQSYGGGCAIHRCCRRSQSAHFRAHAPITGDGKLRKSTYVIDPASWQREGPGDVWEANGEAVVAGFPGYFLSCCRACLAEPLCCCSTGRRLRLRSTSPCAKLQSQSQLDLLSSGRRRWWLALLFAERSGRTGNQRCRCRCGCGCRCSAAAEIFDRVACRWLNSSKDRCKGASRFSGAKLPWMGCAK